MKSLKFLMGVQMDEFGAWQKIMHEWHNVKRAQRLNQQLYDLLGGAIMYLLRYAEKNKIELPNKRELRRMSENVHALIYEINELSDESLQAQKDDRSDDNFT